jgi:hypothetical protein
MTRMVRLAVVSAVLAGGATLAGQVQDRQMGGVGLTVFEDIQFRGDNATFVRDEPTLSAYRLDRRISSLRVGPGEVWEVCANTNFRGPCQVFSGTEPDLRTRNWNDRIRSARRIRGGGGPGPGRGGFPGGDRGIALYSDENFRGQVEAYEAPQASLGSFNDRARSVRVFSGRWELCEDASYRKCRTIDRDLANLSALGLSRRVSSVRPVNSGIVPPGYAVPRGVLVIYDDDRYRGGSVRLDAPESAVGSAGSRARSLRVTGAWQICSGRNFTGRCVTVDGDVPNLSSIGMANRIVSARPTIGR